MSCTYDTHRHDQCEQTPTEFADRLFRHGNRMVAPEHGGYASKYPDPTVVRVSLQRSRLLNPGLSRVATVIPD